MKFLFSQMIFLMGLAERTEPTIIADMGRSMCYEMLKNNSLCSLNNLGGIMKFTEWLELKEGKRRKGKKDACYHKVRARYDVWPSAYVLCSYQNF